MSPVQVNNAISGIGNSGVGQPLSRSTVSSGDFAGTLQTEIQKQSDVKFSAHAQKRLAERNVEFSSDDQARLSEAVNRIEQKGADKSLVLMDNLALLVSARNRTVITAMDSTSAKDGVFTNIDSAVII